MSELALADGWDHGPLFAPPRKQRPLARPHGKQGIVRRSQERRATPPWANLQAIRALYVTARRLTRETGELHVVDHIVPLIGKHGGVQIVSGLHIHWNLRVIHWKENSRRGNWEWPFMPVEQLELSI